MRRTILGLVNQYPGLHMREIQRRAHTSSALAEYHLAALEKLRLVTSCEDPPYRRYFPPDDPKRPLTAKDKEWLGLLRQSVPLGIALHLLEHELAQHKDLLFVTHVAKGTMSYHLRAMEKTGLIKRVPPDTGRAIRLAERDHVLALLRAYPPTPDLASEYLALWEILFGAMRPKDDH